MQYLALECAVRAALIAAATAAVLGILRVKTAAARHTAWAGVMVLMMLLAAWTAWGPKASWRILPAPVAQVSAVRTLPPAAAFTVMASPTGAATPTSVPRPMMDWPTALTAIYLLGFFVLLARLALGTWRAHMLVRRAANRAGMLTSDSCAAPVTVGWFTPTVILPEGWQRWPQAQLDAVLAHEGTHARRRDPLVQWLALLNRALFWFHPLAWWLERRLSALAEEACDAAVLARGCDPFEYSEYLLEMARSVLQTGARVRVLGMAMPGSSLPQRIRWILERRPVQRISRLRMVCVAVACTLASAVFMAGVVDRQLPAQRTEAPVVLQVAPQITPPAATPMPRKRTAIVAQVQPAPAPQASAPPTPELKYQDHRLLVLCFDLRAMSAADRERAFASAQTFLRRQMQPDNLIAIMTAGADVKVREDFTGDRDRLLRTLDQLRAEPGPDSGAIHVDRELASLGTTVKILSTLPGKKSVVYFTTGVVPRDSVELRPLINEAVRAGVAFYTVDAQGLASFTATEPLPKQYVIGAQDVLKIWVVGVDLPVSYVVRPDGVISAPTIGDVQAAGLTVAQLEAVVADRLQVNGVLDHPAVTVGVSHVHPRQ